TYSFTVDWGDGSAPELISSATASHSYTNPGFYHVTMSGSYPRFGYQNCIIDQGRNRLFDIKQWGSNAWTSFEFSFCRATNLNISATDAPNLSMVTNLSSMFAHAYQMNADLNHWDVSNINNMESMFKEALAFNQPLANWNVSQVTNMQEM